MSRKISTGDLTWITDMIDAAFKMQEEGHGDAMVDWMGHFAELDIRIYLGGWSPSAERILLTFRCNMTEEQKQTAYEQYFTELENFYSTLNPAQ